MSDENKAEQAGAVGGVATVGGIGLAAHGSSASVITGTLATIGGGSMVTGIAVTAAAPLVVATTVYGIFKLFD